MAPEPARCERCGHPVRRDLGEYYKRFFAIQQEARDLLDRHIATGGSGWPGSCYGFVAATSAGKGRVSNPDSWRCHHRHEDDFKALECALSEVKRLKAGGEYEPCSDGPQCPDDSCRRDWARVARTAKG